MTPDAIDPLDRLAFTVADLPPPDRRRAVFRLKKLLPEYVFDTAALEDSPFTFPEVQTLMEGITVGGHRVEDARLVQNQIDSWRELLSRVEQEVFRFDRDTACSLQAQVAFEEALAWGQFRVGPVRIAGTPWAPPEAVELESRFESLQGWVEARIGEGRVHVAAVGAFLVMARTQFFWDGNKRTGRLMMNGLLLLHGYDAISVPARQKLAFNQKMIRFYDSGDPSEMAEFLVRDCGGLALSSFPSHTPASSPHTSPHASP